MSDSLRSRLKFASQAPDSRRWSSASAPEERPLAPSEATVLVVDPDGVSRRFVELTLGVSRTEGGLVVEAVKDASAALDVLRTSLVDLILSETDLPDMSVLRFYRRLQQESRLRSIPFVVLSADKRVATKVVALRAGVDDYIVKPCDANELVARVEALVVRQRRLREAQRRRAYTLAGDFSTVPFPDLVSILDLSRRTGLLSIATPRAVGELFFLNGQPVHAVFGNLVGAEAFYRVMGEGTGQFEYNLRAPDACAHRTISESVTALIMEGARQLDDSRANGIEDDATDSFRRVMHKSAGPKPPSGPVAAAAQVPALVPPLAGSRALGAQFEAGVSDEFALGELRLWNADELSRWTRSPGGRDRLHVLLIADLGAGVSSLLGIASQPTERWVLATLTREPKALGMVFYLRNERLLDIVLIDVRNAGTFRSSLGRRPSLAILAPPEGDFLAIGTKGVVELESLLVELSPAIVLGVGNGSLAAHLAQLPSIQKTRFHPASQHAALGEDHTDLRVLLREGIGQWASPTPDVAVSYPPSTSPRGASRP
jgi:CheY-like chemotaxis protein